MSRFDAIRQSAGNAPGKAGKAKVAAQGAPDKRGDAGAATQAAKRKPNPNGVQTMVLAALKDKPIVMRTLDGSEVTATLRAVDRYTIAVTPEDGGPLELWFKQCIAVVRPAQGAEP